MVDLSICCIVKNEVNQIKRICEEWAHPLIELVIVDTGSTDGTLEYLIKTGVEFYSFDWCDDFSKARNYSLNKATGKTILWLDADDHLDELNKSKILELASKQNEFAYKFIIKNPMDDGEGQVFNQTRLFPNFKGIEFIGRVHEELSTSLKSKNIPIQNCDIEIEHRGYIEASERRKKTQRNHKILLEQLSDHPNDPFCLLELANSFYQLKEYSKALGIYLKSLEQRPSNKGSALDSLEMLIGQVYLKLGDHLKASEYFEQSTLSSPEYLGAFYELAKLSLDKAEIKKAKGYFEALLSQEVAVQSMAESKESLRLNSFGYLGLLAFVEKDFVKALEYFENAYSAKWRLCVDPWLILESGYYLKSIDVSRDWQNKLNLSPNNELQTKIINWLAPKNEAMVFTRNNQEEILRTLSKSLNNHDLWKQLKLSANKFDNWERCLQRISSFTKMEILEIQQISQRILNAQSITK